MSVNTPVSFIAVGLLTDMSNKLGRAPPNASADLKVDNVDDVAIFNFLQLTYYYYLYQKY